MPSRDPRAPRRTHKFIFVPGMYFLGFLRYTKSVSGFQVTPLFLLAAVYAKPGTVPDLRPIRPARCGPVLFTPCGGKLC